MSHNQNHSPPVVKMVNPAGNQKPDLLAHGVTAFFTNMALQPLRTCLNYAATTGHPFTTIAQAMPNLLRGMPWNVARGTLSLTSQTWVQAQMHARYGKNTTKGKVMGVGAAAVVGAGVAFSVETLFIRRNRGLPGTRLSLPLLMYYLFRELGFSVYVLGSEHMSPTTNKAAMLASTAATAACHKKAVQHALDEQPDVRTVVTSQPKPMYQRIGPPVNMFFWRGVYLESYKHILPAVRENITAPLMRRLGR